MIKTYEIHYYECNENNCRGEIMTVTVSAATLQSAVHHFEMQYHNCTVVGAEEKEQE